MKLNPTKPLRFEAAVLQALGTLPNGYFQRVDGLMTERVVMAGYPHRFAGLRLWLMERRGQIISRRFGSPLRSMRRMKSYRLAPVTTTKG